MKIRITKKQLKKTHKTKIITIRNIGILPILLIVYSPEIEKIYFSKTNIIIKDKFYNNYKKFSYKSIKSIR